MIKQYITRFTNWYLTTNTPIKILLFPVLMILLLAAIVKLILKGYPDDNNYINTN